MYGWNWEMTLTEGTIDSYLYELEALFASLEGQPLMTAQGHRNLAGRFFGLSAAN